MTDDSFRLDRWTYVIMADGPWIWQRAFGQFAFDFSQFCITVLITTGGPHFCHLAAPQSAVPANDNAFFCSAFCWPCKGKMHRLQQLVSLLSHNMQPLATLEAIRQLQRHSRTLHRLLLHLPRIDDLDVSSSTGLQVGGRSRMSHNYCREATFLQVITSKLALLLRTCCSSTVSATVSSICHGKLRACLTLRSCLHGLHVWTDNTPLSAPNMQGAANAEEVLLRHASRILCHSHIILELSKALLRRGVNAAAIVDALAVAQWGLSVCTTHLSQAAHRIAELEEEQRLRQEVESHMQQLQQEGYDTARLPVQELLRLVLQREHLAQEPMDEELQDTCTSLPTMAQA